MCKGTAETHIPIWQPTFRVATILTVIGITPVSVEDFASLVQKRVSLQHKHETVHASPAKKMNDYIDINLSQISFDQMAIIKQQHQAATSNLKP